MVRGLGPDHDSQHGASLGEFQGFEAHVGEGRRWGPVAGQPDQGEIQAVDVGEWGGQALEVEAVYRGALATLS
jgi:hypothetical protein